MLLVEGSSRRRRNSVHQILGGIVVDHLIDPGTSIGRHAIRPCTTVVQIARVYIFAQDRFWGIDRHNLHGLHGTCHDYEHSDPTLRHNGCKIYLRHKEGEHLITMKSKLDGQNSQLTDHRPESADIELG